MPRKIFSRFIPAIPDRASGSSIPFPNLGASIRSLAVMSTWDTNLARTNAVQLRNHSAFTNLFLLSRTPAIRRTFLTCRKIECNCNHKSNSTEFERCNCCRFSKAIYLPFGIIRIFFELEFKNKHQLSTSTLGNQKGEKSTHKGHKWCRGIIFCNTIVHISTSIRSFSTRVQVARLAFMEDVQDVKRVL